MPAYYNENDPFAAQWLRNLITEGLIAPGDVDDRSIEDVQGSDLDGYEQCHFFAGISGWSLALRLAGWPDDRPVWTGSCPCQPFSSSGAGGGFRDERHLWPAWYRLIQSRTPEIIFGEQVAHDGWHDAVASDMEAACYSWWPRVLRASSVGADHERRRLYWAASHTACVGRAQPWHGEQDAERDAQETFGEADWLVDAVRWEALPYVCRRHDGIPESVGRMLLKGFGNAIVPRVAAEFIAAFLESTPCS